MWSSGLVPPSRKLVGRFPPGAYRLWVVCRVRESAIGACRFELVVGAWAGQGGRSGSIPNCLRWVDLGSMRR
jgi:hypothetical protein